MGLPGRERSLTSSAVWIQYVPERQMDAQIDTGQQQRPPLRIASRGKNRVCDILCYLHTRRILLSTFRLHATCMQPECSLHSLFDAGLSCVDTLLAGCIRRTVWSSTTGCPALSRVCIQLEAVNQFSLHNLCTS